MDVDHPEYDEQWDRAARHETEAQRLDRNWTSLLQELRVVQTGVQLLTGFLLTLPFQQRFGQLDPQLQALYLGTVACSVASTVLLVAPVGMHRMLFRQRSVRLLVSAAHRCAYAGLLLLGTALAGVTDLIFAAVLDPTAGLIGGGAALGLLGIFWLVLPLMMRETSRDDDQISSTPKVAPTE